MVPVAVAVSTTDHAAIETLTLTIRRISGSCSRRSPLCSSFR